MMEHWWNDSDRKLKYSEENLSYFLHHNSGTKWPGIETGPLCSVIGLRMDYEGPNRKHFRADSSSEDDVPRFTLEAVASLPFLPDDVLLCIMKYLGPVELHNLSKITDRFAHLAADKNLWKVVDFRPHKLTSSQLLNYVDYFKKSTEFLALRGFVSEAPDPKWKDEVLTPELLKEICTKCPGLETLILDEHFGVAHKLDLELFPVTLRCLSMKGCVITDVDPQRSYFQKLHLTLPHIKVLVLSNCNWVAPHDFMAISKCYQLEELRMDGCPQLGECVAYTSLAARFGFHSLKILDLRNTRMGDSDVSCFNRSRNLTHLYLQCPSSEDDVSDGLCCYPTCMDLPIRQYVAPFDFKDSSDDDDDDDDDIATSSFVKYSNSHHVFFSPPPPFLLKSLPVISARQTEKTSSLGSRLLIESIGDPSTSCCVSSRMGTDENGDPNLPQASTSYGTLNTLNHPGPSNTVQKVESLKKHSLRDSDSSSDENCSSVSLPASASELHEQTWTMEEGSLLPISQVSCVHETDGRGKKRRHSSSDNSVTPSEASTSAHSFIASKSTNSFKAKNVSAGSTSCCVNEKTSKLQDGYSLCQELKTVPHSSSASLEVNCTQGTVMSKVNNGEQGRNCLRKVHASCCGSFDVGATLRFRRLLRCCRYPGPHIFHHHNVEPSHESTISDLCVMSFVLKDSETGGGGYVRFISPQFVSARPHLHTLVVKNYKMITDASLTYLLKLNSLRYLDVSGTSVTERGVLQFKLKRPDVEIISDYKFTF